MEAPQDLEAAVPKPEKPFALFQSAVLAVAISPQGRRSIAVGLEDGAVEIWDVLTREQWVSYQGHTNSVWSVAFSPDGTKVASGGDDNMVRLWDVNTRMAIAQPFSGHTGFVSSVAFSPDGSMVVSGSWDKTLRLWDVNTGKAIAQPFSGHEDPITSVAFSADGSMVVSGSRDKTIRLWDVKTGEAIGQLFSTNAVNSVAFSPDGSMVVSGSKDNQVWLWDVKTGEAIGQPFSAHTDSVTSVAFSADGNMVVSSSWDHTVRLWDVKTGEAIGQPFSAHTNSVTSVAFSADGNVVVSGSKDNKVWLWDVNTGTAINQLFSSEASFVNSVGFSRDGNLIVSGNWNKTLQLWDVNTGEAIGQPLSGHRSSVRSVAFSPDGSMVVSGSRDNTVRLWDVKTGEAVGQPFSGHTDTVNSVAFSPDGSKVVSGSDDKTVRLWDIKTGQAIAQPFYGHIDAVNSVAFSPDGNIVVSGSYDKTVRLWDVKTGKAIGQPFYGHTNSVTSVAFSPNGSKVVSGSDDKTVRLWDVKTGKAIGQPFYGHTHSVTSVAFSINGSKVASSSHDKTVRLWDISDPQRKRQIIIGEHQGEVYSVAFDPQGDYIISAGEDGIKVWRWQRFNIRRVPQPFRNDQPTGEDSLDVAKELQSLADVLMLRSLEPPLAVAILGSWGSGKSFGMHLIEKHITKIRCQQLTTNQTWGDIGDEPNLSPYVGHIYQIKFNAWSYAKSDLWASLMQTIFDQLDRQLTLEQQLGEVSDLLAGGEIWRVINQMNESDKKAILESELNQEVFAKLKQQNTDSNALWDILSQVRQEEQDNLKRTEEELHDLETQFNNKNQEIEQKFNQEIEQLEQEFNQTVKQIEKNVDQKMTDVSTVIVFLSQLKEILKDDFGDSILKDFLNTCGFKNRKDLEAQFPMLNLDKLNESNLLNLAQELIENKNIQIEPIINNFPKITHFLEEQPSSIVAIIEFIRKEKKILLIFLGAIALPFIAYFLIISVIPKFLPALLEISTALKFWLTSVSAIPALSTSINIFKRIQVLQIKTVRFLQLAKENVKQEKQKLNQTKNEKFQEEINQRKAEYEQNQIKEINKNKELAQQELIETQQKIEKLKLQVERQKQRVGLTAQYKSLLDFVNNRLNDNSYQKLLGLMHQIQDDLADLSEHLTYKLGNTNPEKLKVLKKYFPRGPARIVLYIDDLDRCPPERVVQVLEAIQLLLKTEIFIIVLGIDDRYIGRTLEHIYRGVLKRGGTPSGVDYLEKIIQIPYRMRPISKNITATYLKSLVDIEEEIKQENLEDFSLISPENQENSFIEQINDENILAKNLEELPEELQEDLTADEIPTTPFNSQEETKINLNPSVDIPTKASNIQDIDEPKNKKNNSNTNNRRIQHLANTDPLISFEKFTVEEFAWISECCQHVDLTPRTAKRLINICKIIKIIWTPLPNDNTWKEEPTPEYKQTLIAFLALAGRYPKEIRKILEEIYLEFEETDGHTVTIKKEQWLNRLQKQDIFMDIHNQREWKKFKNDFMKMSPPKEFVFEKRTFNLARSFCFVGDIGYDPDDFYNREYRFEDGKKDYGFKKSE
ncbi:P-loop NTPase fold protein [Anabaena azotica]|uniref:P-loop NTPase fold protein n=1 Tax=Anabaena azotica TaxID=197653 RepID=UPI0039A53E2C